ncbi:YadA-like family protein [Paraburkholderia sp. Ac-20340]|uniref:YadA-like family protein n=1 Tax=Paraburkholderia sp. Ac-20340 TaxID=2703888 RepID=UPI00321628C3
MNSVALGGNANASVTNSVALGNNTTTTAAVATASGVIGGTTYNYAGTNPTGVVSVGSAGVTRQIQNVAAGQVAATSTDAINGSQLFATNTAVTTVANNVTNVSNTVNNITNGSTGIKYFHVNSTQADSVASGSGAMAIGQISSASGNYATAMGYQAQAAGLEATAIGVLSAAGSSAAQGLALGARATVTGAQAVALGSSSTATGSQAVALGSTSKSTGSGSVAIGNSAFAGADYTTAIGNFASASGDRGVAMGASANASGSYSTALGTSAAASGVNSTAIGTSANASVANSVALGNNTTTTAAVATASGVIGGTTYNYAGTNPTGVVSVGSAGVTRQIQNVAAGQVSAASTDAINGSQLYATNTAVTTVANNVTNVSNNVTNLSNTVNNITNNGAGIKYFHVNSTQADSAAVGQNSVAIGGAATSFGGSGIALGSAATSVGVAAVAMGVNAKAVGASAVSIGNSSYAGTDYTTAIGNAASAVGDRSVAMGASANAGGSYSTALGTLANAAGDRSVALGTGANASVANSVALGNGSTTTAAVATASGVIGGTTYNYAGTNPTGVVSVGSAGATRQIQNVAAGQVSAASTDAVNGSQLFATNQKVTQNTGDISNIYSQMSTIGGSVNSVAYDSSAHNSVTLGGVGTSHAPVSLTNVANGAVNAASVDAVNGAQLYAAGYRTDPSGNAVNAFVTYDDTSMNKVTLGGASHTPVVVSNVANGVAPTDAVNVQQMTNAVATGNPYIGGVGANAASTPAQATGVNSIALGLGSVADQSRTVSVGNSATNLQRRITNVASGRDATDAVNLGQVNDLMGNVTSDTQAALKQSNSQMLAAIQQVNNQLQSVSQTVGSTTGNSLYFQADGSGDPDGTDGAYVRSGTYSVAVGARATATGDTAVALGAQTLATVSGTTALGNGATATGQSAIAIGDAFSSGPNAIALGAGTVATGNQSIALGNNTKAQGLNAMAFGYTAMANAPESISFGTLSQVSAASPNSIAIGRSSKVTANAKDSVALGSSSVADRMNSISVGSTVQQRQITYLAAGTASTDAVNVSQLTDAVSAFGASASVGADGSIVKPSYVVGDTTYNNVGDALVAIQKAGDSDAVSYDSSAKASVTLGGVGSSKPVALHNVANGAKSNDAVNVAQLQAMGGSFDSSGNVTNAFVVYDDTSKGSVTLGGVGSSVAVALHNVANGATSNDAVNVAQLQAMGGSFDSSGNVTNAFVAYDDTSKGSVTLGGVGSSVAVALHNVANGATSNDAVNVAQLQAMGGSFDSSGNVTNAFVAYDDTSKGSVTLGGVGSSVAVALHNVANGATSSDAVNVAQLQAMGGSFDSSGNVTNAFVAYDDTSKGSVTLGGVGSSVAVALHNVANGATSNDAVNVAQLQAMGGSFDSSGNVTNAFVAYDDTSKGSVTLGGAGSSVAVALHNVANGATSNDAVNVAQLQAMGGSFDSSGNVTNAFVAYDDTSKGSVTLGGVDSSVAVALHNVANGATSNDAVNVAQLQAMGGSFDSSGNVTNAFVAYDDTSKGSVTLGGVGSSVAVALHNVANGATSNDAVNVAQLQAMGGSFDSSGNVTNAFVAYDDTSKGSVTLGGAGSSVAVALHNVANGATSNDAVNVAQLQAMGGSFDSSGNVTNAFVAYDDTSKGSVTLGGVDSSVAVALHNVANGATSNDAVNVAQLQAMGGSFDSSGNVTNAFVAYDDTSKGSVTLGGVGSSVAVALHNVASGAVNASSADAINGAQLYAAGFRTDSSGNAANAFVAYDDTSMNKVTLGGVGASHTPVVLSNVANGVASTDAVNVQQMTNAVVTGNPYIGGVGAGPSSTPAQATGLNSIALGLGSVADQSRTVSVGNSAEGLQRRITNVANAKDDGDAVNLGQVNDLLGVVTTDTQAALKQSNSQMLAAIQKVDSQLQAVGATADNSLYFQADGSGDPDGTDGAYVRTGTYSVAVGARATASGDTAVAIGAQSLATVSGTTAIGNGATATGQGSLALGDAFASSTNGVALGNGTVATGNQGVAVGSNTKAYGLNSIAFGNTAIANGPDSMAFGTLAQVSAASPNSIAIGRASNVLANAKDSVALGSSSIADRMNSISVGSTVQQRQIIYVAAGTASTDAVNVSQLASAVSAFGGSASVGADGSIVSPTYKVGSKTFSNVGEAIAALNDNGGGGGTGTDPLAVHYTDNSKSTVSLGEGSATPVLLTNLAAGSVNAASVDAVNGAQLYNLANSAANAIGGGSTVNGDGSISAPTYNIGGKTYSNAGDTFTALYGDITNISGLADAVQYDSSAHDSVTLGGADSTTPVALHNVANGALSEASSDAVNGAQLYAAGLRTDTDGNVTNAFVTYDDTSMASVTLGGTGHDPVKLTNVAAGDVNPSSVDAVNGAQLYNLASSAAGAIGGGSTVNGDGSISAPTYNIGGKTYSNAGDTFTALYGDITNISGLADAVQYDSSAHDKISLGGVGTSKLVTLTNVAPGKVGASSVDAVNGGQLFGLADSTAKALGGSTSVTSNGAISAPSYVLGGGTYSNVGAALDAVMDAAKTGSVDGVSYDSSAHDSVTLGGYGKSHAPVTLTNVAAGAQDLDAVNVAQLKAAGLNIGTSGNVLNAFVSYDDASKTSITLGGVGSKTPVALHNVANGVTQNDAVNVAQLQAMGALIGSSGNVTNAFVAYDDSTKSSVTFGGVGHAPVKLQNVAAGILSSSSTDAVNGTQLYNVASSTISALGGGSTVGADGKISAPTYKIGASTFNNVGGAISNIDARVTSITTQISGAVANAVQYDSSAHDKLTLGGTTATTAVALTNVANGVLSASSLDAVNGSQLYATNVTVENLNQAIQNISTTGSQYIATNTSNGAASATGANSVAVGGGAVASGTSSTAMGDAAKATGNNSVALGANSVADQDNTVSVGSEGNERRITNVANGVNATDAANVGQLQSGLNAVQSSVNSVARNAYGGIAAATALTMIPDVDQGKNIAVGVGTANFQGYQAVALGASARITQNIKVKVGGGYASGGGATVGGGMSYQW